MSEEYFDLGRDEVAALLDGKDFLVHVKCSDDKLRRFLFSDKLKVAAARCITFTTPMGLAFECTKLFGARVTEVTLVKLWGSLGILYAPLLAGVEKLVREKWVCRQCWLKS